MQSIARLHLCRSAHVVYWFCANVHICTLGKLRLCNSARLHICKFARNTHAFVPGAPLARPSCAWMHICSCAHVRLPPARGGEGPRSFSFARLRPWRKSAVSCSQSSVPRICRCRRPKIWPALKSGRNTTGCRRTGVTESRGLSYDLRLRSEFKKFETDAACQIRMLGFQMLLLDHSCLPL